MHCWHVRCVRMRYTVAIKPEAWRRIYWTKVPIDTLVSVHARGGVRRRTSRATAAAVTTRNSQVRSSYPLTTARRARARSRTWPARSRTTGLVTSDSVALATETAQSRWNSWRHSASIVAVQDSPISVLNIAWYRWGSGHFSPRYCWTNAARALSVVSISSIALS
jgi:hypothetical protein